MSSTDLKRRLFFKNPKVGIVYNIPLKLSSCEVEDFIAEKGVEEEVEVVEEALEKLGLDYFTLGFGNDFKSFFETLKEKNFDVVINLCESVYGDSRQEMNFPALLELCRVPYTGSPPLTLGLCQNKGLVKDILMSHGVSTPDYRILTRYAGWKGEISFPLFVKPIGEDASIGISEKSYVRSETELWVRVDYINREYKQPAIVEEFIDGREINVAILGNNPPMVLPLSEIVFSSKYKPKVVSYSAKWIKDSADYAATKTVCPAILEKSVKDSVEACALKAYEVLGCRDYARVDIRLKESRPFVLEVNPNPDISSQAGLARSLEAASIDYKDFIGMMLEFALERGLRYKKNALFSPYGNQ